eukprot:13712-Amphidinium_carterae.1
MEAECQSSKTMWPNPLAEGVETLHDLRRRSGSAPSQRSVSRYSSAGRQQNSLLQQHDGVGR